MMLKLLLAACCGMLVSLQPAVAAFLNDLQPKDIAVINVVSPGFGPPDTLRFHVEPGVRALTLSWQHGLLQPVNSRPDPGAAAALFHCNMYTRTSIVHITFLDCGKVTASRLLRTLSAVMPPHQSEAQNYSLGII
jgi:hypothetical protein